MTPNFDTTTHVNADFEADLAAGRCHYSISQATACAVYLAAALAFRHISASFVHSKLAAACAA